MEQIGWSLTRKTQHHYQLREKSGRTRILNLYPNTQRAFWDPAFGRIDLAGMDRKWSILSVSQSLIAHLTEHNDRWCEHANENSLVCSCPQNCVCKTGTCKDRAEKKEEEKVTNPATVKVNAISNARKGWYLERMQEAETFTPIDIRAGRIATNEELQGVRRSALRQVMMCVALDVEVMGHDLISLRLSFLDLYHRPDLGIFTKGSINDALRGR